MMKLSLWVFVALFSLVIFSSSNDIFADESNQDIQSKMDSATKWANTPMILIYNVHEREPQYPFVEFREGQIPWFDRLVQDRMILAGNAEILEYLEMIGHDDISVRYVTNDGKDPKYYSIRLIDPGLSLDEHHIRANFIYFQPDKFTAIDIDDDDIPGYLKHAFEESDWTALSDEEYSEFKEYVKDNGAYYEITSKDSRVPEYYKMAYVGPESEEVRQGSFTNNFQDLDIAESKFGIVPKEKCIPASSHNDANDFLPYYERFSVTDKTGEQIYRIPYGESITVRYNPYNDWAENLPFTFGFGIKYHDGDRWFTIHTEKKTIGESLCDVTDGFEWVFTPDEPGTYELSIDRINSERGSEFERRITVEKNNVFNAMQDDPDFLQNMGSDGFASDLYRIVAEGSGEVGISFDDVDWSSDGSFVVYQRHDSCPYVDSIGCDSPYSLWRLDIREDASPQELLIPVKENPFFSNLRISPDGTMLAMNGYYEQNGDEHNGIFLHDFQTGILKQITGQSHITSLDWMPDNTILYHETVSQTEGILWNMDANGDAIKKVYEGSPNFGYLDVNDDGTKVSFKEIHKEPARRPPPSQEEFVIPGTITWFDMTTKEFFEETIRSPIYATTKWSPDGEHLYYLGVRSSPAIIGKLNINTGEDIPIAMENKNLHIRSEFALNSKLNSMIFSRTSDGSDSYESIFVMDLNSPSADLVQVSEISSRQLMCESGKIVLNEQCVSEKQAIQHGCETVDQKCIFNPVKLDDTIFAECKRDLDWQHKPCYTINSYPGIEQEKKDWSAYSRTKPDFLWETKLKEIKIMMNADNFQGWVEKHGPLDGKNEKFYESNENKNVWYYHYLQGSVPHYKTGKYIQPDYREILGENKIKDFDCPIKYDEVLCPDVASPLKQTQSGTAVEDIQCKESLVLLLKYDGSPFCVKSKTAEILKHRGWADRIMNNFCFGEHLPVCGKDNVTYGNQCYLEREHVELKHLGECKNKDKIIAGFEYSGSTRLTVQEQEDYCEERNAFRTGPNACQYNIHPSDCSDSGFDYKRGNCNPDY